MAAMGTELRSARETFGKCSDKGVEVCLHHLQSFNLMVNAVFCSDTQLHEHR
jgi:hypothetical protein